MAGALPYTWSVSQQVNCFINVFVSRTYRSGELHSYIAGASAS